MLFLKAADDVMIYGFIPYSKHICESLNVSIINVSHT